MSKSKEYLKSAERLDIIKEHRKVRSEMGRMMEYPDITQLKLDADNFPFKPKKGDSLSPTLKPMDLSQVKPAQEWIYYNKVLKVTIFDDPLPGFCALNLLVEDKNGIAIRVSIYDIPQNKDTCEKLKFGTKIGIIHPHYRIALDGKPAIRVEDPETIVVYGSKKDMCRYCGKENAERKCSKCKRFYCNRECQIADWKQLDHKLICKTNLS